MELTVVLTSAAVSAVVSGLFTFVSQMLERWARRREFVMKIAADLAMKQYDFAAQLTAHGTRVDLPSVELFAYMYYRQLTWLMKRGKLSPEDQKKFDHVMTNIYGPRPQEESAPRRAFGNLP